MDGKMKAKILYMDDEWDTKEIFAPILAKSGQVRLITSEYDFRRAIDDIKRKKRDFPELCVLGVAVRWADESIRGPMPEQPEEVRKQGLGYAGIRSYAYLRKAEKRTGHGMTPVIFLSFMQPDHIMADMTYRGYTNSLDPASCDPQDYQCALKSEPLSLTKAVRNALHV